MEKILEFKKGKVFDEDSKYYRFQCDCLTPSDAMDVEVESCGEDNEGKYIILSLNFYGTGFWDRAKYALAVLRGYWSWREFVVRKEDFKVLSNIFNPKKKYSQLP